MGRVQRLKKLGSHPDFARLLGAQVAGQAGDGVAQAALAVILVLDPLGARTPGRIFGLFALTLLPYSLISPFMGVVIDRYSRRRLLVWTSGLRALVVITLPLWRSAIPGQIDLYATSLVLLGLSRLFLTTKGAMLPTVLGERNLLSGNAVSSGGGMLAALLGGILGVALSGLDESIAFLAAGALYVATAVISSSLGVVSGAEASRHEPASAAAGRVARELISGIAQICRRRPAWVPLAAIFLLRTIGMIVAISAILVIKSQFSSAGESGGRLTASAVALGVIGAGAFCGTLVAPAIGRSIQRGGLIVTGFVISGIAIIAVGGVENLVALLALTFAGGFAGLLAKVAVDASVQDALPPNLRGRAFALYDILYNGASVVAGGVMVTAAGVGLRLCLVVTGVTALVLVAPLVVSLRAAGLFAGSDRPQIGDAAVRTPR